MTQQQAAITSQYIASPLADTKLYCFVTVEHLCKQLARRQKDGHKLLNLQPFIGTLTT